jgi:hypothetical protein
MRRILGICIVATVLAAVTSCGTAKRIEQQPTAEEERTQLWAGKEYSDIVQSYGDPDRIAPDGNDGSILIYETVSTSMETDDNATTLQEERDYTHFYLNQEGFCYLVESNQYVPGIARTKTGNGSWLTSFGAEAVMALAIPIIIYLFDDMSDDREM